MFQVAYINESGYFDVKFIEEREIGDYLKTIYKEQICSIAKDYLRLELDGFEFKEGEWERVLTYNGEMIGKDYATNLDGLGWVKTSELGLYKKCDICGKYHHKHKLFKVHDAENGNLIEICAHCKRETKLFECSHCGKLYINASFETVVSGAIVCDECASADVVECYSCGKLFFREQLHYDIDDNLICYNCEDDCDDYIDDYQHNRDLSKLYLWSDSDEDRKKMLGIELEIGKGPDYDHILAKYCINQMDGNLVCKHDGSINGYGFEMVTHPMTYNYYETIMPAWSNILAKCKKRGFESGTRANTGMHIHINRPWFGPAEIRDGRIDRMLYLFEGFWDNILKFANRSEEKANDWAGRYVHNSSGKYKKSEIKERSKGGNRYRAVNLCNSNTVEIRIFNGTLDEEQFFANVQLVKRFMDIITTYSEEEFYELTWKDIVTGDSQYTYLVSVGNRTMGHAPLYKLKERFEDMENSFEGCWREFPIGTKVRVNIDRTRSYRSGFSSEMLELNGTWIELDETVPRTRVGDDVLYNHGEWYYSLDMFDDYRLPHGTDLTVNISPERYYRDITITRTMYGHNNEIRRVESHTETGIKLSNLKNYYDVDMFKELKYINEKLGGRR